MRRLTLLLPLLLAACATGPTLDQRLSTFIGQNELQLVSALGVPARTYETDGVKFLQFESQRTVALPGDPLGYGPGLGGGFYGRRRGYYGGGLYGGGFAPPSYAVVGCDVTFSLRDERVAGFSFRGEGCA